MNTLDFPEIKFDHGLTGKSSKADFAKALGFGIPANDMPELIRHSDRAELRLSWLNYAIGQRLQISLSRIPK